MTVRTPMLRWAAAVLVTVAAGLGVSFLPAQPASAGTCSSSSGVSVVVDFGSLGGGVQTACVGSGGGERASSLFPDAGFGLDYVQSQPGFVCRVSGAPSSDPCVNTPSANASWALWWSDGTSGNWSYSNYGVGSLKVPDGGYVGFAWQSSETHTPPGAAASPHASAASATPTPSPAQTSRPTKSAQPHSTKASTPTKAPTRTPSSTPTPQPVGAPASAAAPSATGTPPVSAAATPSASVSASTSASTTSSETASDPSTPKPSTSVTPTADAASTAPAQVASTPAASAAPAVSADPPDASGGSALPAWLVVLFLVVLFGVAGVITVVRRRTRSAV